MIQKFVHIGTIALLFSPAALHAAILQSQVVDGANTVGQFNFGQSVTTPAGGPWNNIRFHFNIGESGQLFDPTATGAFGTLFLLSQSYSGTAAGLSNATPGFLASTASISGGTWQFAPEVTLQENTQYFFFMGSALGPTQVLWQSNGNNYAGGNGFQSFAGINYAALPSFDNVFVLQGDVAGVPEPSTFVLFALGLALPALRLPLLLRAPMRHKL